MSALIAILVCVLLAALSCSEQLPDEKFFSAARSGDEKVLLEYLQKGVSAHSRDGKGNTAIIIASGRGQVNIIQILLEYEADPEDVTLTGLFEGKTTLSWAASQGRTQTVAILLQAGADPHRIPTDGIFEGKTSLMWAASQGRTDVVRLLISAGVPVDYAPEKGNFRGKTALMWACSQGRLETVAALLEAGANPNAVDVDGVSGLMWASGSEVADGSHKKGLLEKAQAGHAEVVKKLLIYGANPDKRDKDGITAIMYAAYQGHYDVLLVLLQWGADADIKSNAGKTALQLARNAGFIQSIEVIRQGPNILQLPMSSDLLAMSTCGWLLSVLRAPRGTGVYPVLPHADQTGGRGVDTEIFEGSQSRCTTTEDMNKRTGGHGSGIDKDKNKEQCVGTSDTNTLAQELDQGGSPYTIQRSCAALSMNGLHSSIGDLLEIIDAQNMLYRGTSPLSERDRPASEANVVKAVREVVHHLGVLNFGAQTRATQQLMILYDRYQKYRKKGNLG